jgi:hypothetical protein
MGTDFQTMTKKTDFKRGEWTIISCLEEVRTMSKENVTVSKGDVISITKLHGGNKIFQKGLDNIGCSKPALMQMLAQYIQFNSVFGAGVANLAGEIARKQDIFSDPAEAVSMLADRSCDVAATIFFAAIDEFGRRKTHRSMAQDTLRETAQFFNIPSDKLKTLGMPLSETVIAMSAVVDGYCLDRSSTGEDLLFGIGFHIGSELLADQEFNILDNYLRRHHPLLVACLQKKKAYTWVSVHTTVEADHFDAALESANLALKFFTGDQQMAHTSILNGFKHFSGIQTRFMQSLVDQSAESTEVLSIANGSSVRAL